MTAAAAISGKGWRNSSSLISYKNKCWSTMKKKKKKRVNYIHDLSTKYIELCKTGNNILPSMARPPPNNLKYKSKINGWEATVTYVPSHRPKNRARVRRSYYRRRQRFFVMHNLKPSYIVPNGKGVARVFNVSTKDHKQPYLPKFPKSLLPDLDEYWGSMLVGVTNNDFRYKQYGEHGRHYRCGGRYLKRVVDIAKSYIEPGSDRELISVMQKKGFFPGYKYKCGEFRKALNVGLRHRIVARWITEVAHSRGLVGEGDEMHMAEMR